MTAPKTSASPYDPNAVSVGSSALFAVGDAFKFIGDGYTASHVISSIGDDGWIHFGESKMQIHSERFEIALNEGRARPVDSANAGGMARELAALDSESPTDING